MELFILVNPEKHKQKLKESYEDLTLNIINVINNNTEGVIKELSFNMNEFKRLYNKIRTNEGSILSFNESKKVVDYIFRVNIIEKAIEVNYHAIKLNQDIISEIKNYCTDMIYIYHEIKLLQNKNLNKNNYEGLNSLIHFELNNNPELDSDFIFSNEFERIVRLELL